MRIIYLHGFASSPSSKKAAYFRDRFAGRGVVLEIPAMDGGDFENLTISGQLGLLEELARGEPVSLMGSSMGGFIAALYAARHVEVGRLVLLAPAFGFTRRWPAAMGAAGFERWRREGKLEVFHFAENRHRHVGFTLYEDGARYEDFPDFLQPALIFHGRNDTVVPLELSRQFAATRTNVTLHAVDSDHELMNVRDEVWRLSEQFLIDPPLCDNR